MNRASPIAWGPHLQPGWTESTLETGPTGLGIVSENVLFKLDFEIAKHGQTWNRLVD